MQILPSRAVPEIIGKELPSWATDFDPMQVPRSVNERLSFVPWWRIMLATYYKQQMDMAAGKNQPWSLPVNESDELVIAAYALKAFCACGKPELTRAMRWCNDAHYRSSSNGAKIRAMIVGGMTDEQIAPHFATVPENIAMYASLFFDIRECLRLPHWMDTFLRLENPNMISGSSDTNEVTWLSMSYHLGQDVADHAMSGRLPYLNAQDLSIICNKICDIIAGQAFVHVVSNNVIHGGGRAVDLERYLQILDIKNREGGPGHAGGNSTPGAKVDVVEWMLEAAERKIFDSAKWNEVRGATGLTRKIIDMEMPEMAYLPPSTRMSLGPVQKKRIMDSMMPARKLPCKRTGRSVTLPLP
jgi:hypothetical protein